MSDNPAAADSPKRGGTHPIYGRFLGGAKLTNEYKSDVPDGRGNGLYRFSTQRRHEKTIGNIERALQEARDSPTAIKFNGQLEPGDGNLTEIGKERFLLLLERRVIEHGQQTFYYVKDSDGNVVNLFEHSHRFTLQTVIEEHDRRSESTNRAANEAANDSEDETEVEVHPEAYEKYDQ